MTTTDMVIQMILFIIALITFFCLGWRLGNKNHDINRIIAEEMAEMWEGRFNSLRDSIDEEAQREFEALKKGWWPEPTDQDEAFKLAEIMANRRQMRDANRVHLPRPDAGPPARVHKGKVHLPKTGQNNNRRQQ